MLVLTKLFHPGSFRGYIGLAAATIFILFVAVGCKKKEDSEANVPVRPVKVITVTDMSDAGHVSLPAKTRANQRVDLSFKVAGPLVALPVEEGQEIREGQVVARIDPRDFETRVKRIKSALSEAQAQLKSMTRGERPEVIKMLEAEVTAAEAEYQFAQDQYNRYEQLFVRQFASKADFDRQTSLKNTAKARLASARQNLARGKKGARKEDVEAQQSRIRGLEAQLKAAQDALDDTFLKAPFTGVVAKRYVENHQEIQAKQPVIFFQDISKIEILVDVPETLAVKIRDRHEPEVVVRFEAAPDRVFPLTLKEFSTEADPQTLTYQAVLVMPRPGGLNILPGMTATIEGTPKPAAETPHRIVIPAAAVTIDPEKNSCVWVLNKPDMAVSKRIVHTGELTGSDSIVILDGLSGGEKIVTAGVTKLYDGMKVSVWKADR